MAIGFVGKEELLRRIDEEYTKMSELLLRIMPQKAMEARAVGDWSVRDLVSHFIAHEQRALDELRHAEQGIPYTFNQDNDEFNAQAVEATRGLPFDVILGNWRKSVQQVKDAIAAIPDAEFMPGSNLQQWLGDSIDGALANNTYEHWEEHLPQLQSWLSSI